MRRGPKEGTEKRDRCYIRVYSQGRWQLKQRYLWERRYGAIPDGFQICFLDGDRTNFSMGNLVCLPMGANTYIKNVLGSDRTAELTRTAILTYELMQAAKGVVI